MQIRSVREADLKNKLVLLRTDYNVPLENGVVSDSTRILESIDNIKFILEQGADKVIIVSHVGRPDGIVVEDLRMKPIIPLLESFLSEDIDYLSCPITEVTRKQIRNSYRKIIVLENIRFESGEEKGDEKLAARLAKLADVFVLDGFSVAHRSHASVTKIAKFLPSYGGLTLLQELNKIDEFLSSIKKPFWGFFGGIKLSDKIPVIKALSTKLDGIVFGSSIAVAFLKKYGFSVGSCVVSEDSDKAVDDFWQFWQKLPIKLIFPQDFIVSDSLLMEKKSVVELNIDDVIAGKIKPFTICDDGEAIYDIGEKSISQNKMIIERAGSIFLNGPFGFAEKSPYEVGSVRLLNDIASSQAVAMVGGGDTISLINKQEMSEKFKYLSTSGGALMEYIAFGTLPGLEVLKL